MKLGIYQPTLPVMRSNENFKTTIPSETYDRPKTTSECGIF